MSSAYGAVSSRITSSFDTPIVPLVDASTMRGTPAAANPLQHAPRAVDVQPHHPLRVVGIARHRAREVADRLDTLERAVELGAGQHVAADVLDAEIGEIAERVRARSAHRVAALDQHAAQVLSPRKPVAPVTRTLTRRPRLSGGDFPMTPLGMSRQSRDIHPSARRVARPWTCELGASRFGILIHALRPPHAHWPGRAAPGTRTSASCPRRPGSMPDRAGRAAGSRSRRDG